MERVLEVEVGGDRCPIGVIVSRVLHRREVVDLIVVGHNDHAARVLAGGALDTGTAQRSARSVSAVGVEHVQAPLLQL